MSKIYFVVIIIFTVMQNLSAQISFSYSIADVIGSPCIQNKDELLSI